MDRKHQQQTRPVRNPGRPFRLQTQVGHSSKPKTWVENMNKCKYSKPQAWMQNMNKCKYSKPQAWMKNILINSKINSKMREMR
mmetsp:Transcript_15108/g.26552  ORF Transcript_15108/g.26552 Transcript_15108/m.26552 type:complete len:83 (+) Transcript_15108:249-497(+)